MTYAAFMELREREREADETVAEYCAKCGMPLEIFFKELNELLPPNLWMYPQPDARVSSVINYLKAQLQQL